MATAKLDPKFVALVTGGATGYTDIFYKGSYCGYWATGIKHDPGLGWLAFEVASDRPTPTEDEKSAAIASWLAREEVPEGFLRFDHGAAARGFRYGVERWGAQWFGEGDGDRYDAAVQYGVLGEVRYG